MCVHNKWVGITVKKMLNGGGSYLFRSVQVIQY